MNVARSCLKMEKDKIYQRNETLIKIHETNEMASDIPAADVDSTRAFLKIIPVIYVCAFNTMSRMRNKLTFPLFHLTCRDFHRFEYVRKRTFHSTTFHVDVVSNVFTAPGNYCVNCGRLMRLPKMKKPIMLHQIDSAINLTHIFGLLSLHTAVIFAHLPRHVNGCTISVVSIKSQQTSDFYWYLSDDMNHSDEW